MSWFSDSFLKKTGDFAVMIASIAIDDPRLGSPALRYGLSSRRLSDRLPHTLDSSLDVVAHQLGLDAQHSIASCCRPV